MRMMKKVAALALAGAMMLSISVSAFALTGVSAEEQKILDAAPAKAAELGISTSSPEYAKYLGQAQTYLQQNDLDSTQVNGALSAMNEATAKAKQLMQEKGVSKLSDLDPNDLQSLRSECSEVINNKLASVGIKVKVNSDGTVDIVQVPVNSPSADNPNTQNTQREPNTVITTTKVIKQTGSDMSATVVVGAAVVGAIAACGVFAKKKGLFSKTEA